MDGFHERLAGRLRVHFGCPVKVHGKSDGWKRACPGTEIEFAILSRDGLVEYETRNEGGRCSVVRLSPGRPLEPGCWVSWRDAWEALGARQRFKLVNLSWTFFWGLAGRDKVQLLRAEWATVGERGNVAAQPHWHSDVLPEVDAHQSERRAQADDESDAENEEASLVEVTEVPPRYRLSLPSVHLGMGGWTHGDSHPERWQSEMGCRTTVLVDWATYTLELAKHELARLRVLPESRGHPA